MISRHERPKMTTNDEFFPGELLTADKLNRVLAEWRLVADQLWALLEQLVDHSNAQSALLEELRRRVEEQASPRGGDASLVISNMKQHPR